MIEHHLAQWHEIGHTKTAFLASIARLDDPQHRAEYHALTKEEQEQLDDEVFFYVYSQEEFDDLFNKDNGLDFYLIKQED